MEKYLEDQGSGVGGVSAWRVAVIQFTHVDTYAWRCVQLLWLSGVSAMWYPGSCQHSRMTAVKQIGSSYHPACIDDSSMMCNGHDELLDSMCAHDSCAHNLQGGFHAQKWLQVGLALACMPPKQYCLINRQNSKLVRTCSDSAC